MLKSEKEYLKKMAKSLLKEAVRSHPVQELKREVQSIFYPLGGGRPEEEPPCPQDTYTDPAAPPPPPAASERPPPAAPGRPAPAVLRKGRKAPAFHVGGFLMILFGAVGLVPLSLGFIGSLIFLFTEGFLAAAIAAGVCGALLLGCILLITGGSSLLSRNKRLRAYLREIGISDFCPLSQLAAVIGKEEAFVARDLQKLLRLGKFPHARLDKNNTCLILNPETYQEYLRAEEAARRQRELEEKARREKEERGPPTEVENAIAEGVQIIRRINEMNALIPGADISRKIDRIERVTAKIFQTVEQHPDKLPEIRKFMNYYLPTTLKLLKSYHEFEQQPVQGENIAKAQNEISGALDTVCTAFNNLLDSLFQDAVFDISTDISVLETMLAQEGLTGKNDFGGKGR